MRQEQIRVTITKIHNWPCQSQLISLDFQFYSKQSQYLITRKHVDSRPNNNQLEVGISLKIRYPANESIIVIAVKQTNEDRHDIGELEIDLQKFKEGGTKYVAFGGFQKIMQLEVLSKDGDKNKQQGSEVTMQERRVKNRQFILGRQKFLQEYTNQQNKLKQQFQQKITIILNYQSQKKPVREFKRTPQEKEYEEYQISETQLKTRISQQIVTKSAINNEKKFEYPANLRSSHINVINTDSNRSSAIMSRYSNLNGLAYLRRNPSPLQFHSPCKHKLILNTLNIVSKEDANLA